MNEQRALHAANVDPTKMTDEEYYAWMNGLYDEDLRLESRLRFMTDMCKFFHTRAQELETQLELAELDGPL